MKLVFCLGLFLAATALSFGQTEKAKIAEKAAQKKEQRLKVMVNQNGKTIQLDTTFNFADQKMAQLKIDSILGKLEMVDGKSGAPHVIIMRSDGKSHTMNHSGVRLPGEGQVSVFYQKCDTSDAVSKKKVVMIGNGEGFTMFDGDGAMVPPPPPPPPPPFAPAMRVKGFNLSGGDPFAMDPDDADIITYDKKDIGKGLEKITIVRKKHSSGEREKEVQVKVEVSDDDKK